jgi:SsrA-binding protein
MKHQTKYTDNRKAFFNYEILETIEAGIELLGFEAKAVKAGRASLEGAYIIARGGEAFLVKTNIAPFQQGNTPKDYDPLRNRKLLLHKNEISRFTDIEKGKSQTIIPIALYNNAGRIKVEVAIARGKKKHDKRETIKKREVDREIRRNFKN